MKKETPPATSSMAICRMEVLMLAGAQHMANDKKMRREVAKCLS